MEQANQIEYIFSIKSFRKSIKSCSKLHHDLPVLRWLHFHCASWVFVHIERINNTKRQFIWLEFSCKSVWLFYRNYLIQWIEFVQKENKKFVKKLANTRVVALTVFWHIFTLNNFEITFEKCISFYHTENFRFRWSLSVVTASIVATSSSFFWFELFYRDWIVNCLRLLAS